MDEDPTGQAKDRNKSKQKSGFATYSFMYELYKAILVNGLKNPTPVQRKVIPVVMAGKDAIVCYKTGSGKTLAYLLPMINKLKCHSKVVGARALILIPTRQLAEQISKVLRQYIKFTDLKYTLLLGGHTYEGQFESLSTNPDIIVATPGRLMELLQETDLKLGRVQMIVYDEADMLFQNKSFYDQLKEITQKCTVSQRIMLSATINETLNEFVKTGLRDYSYIHQEVTLPQKMTIDAFIVRPEEKTSALLYLLENTIKDQKAIVFASTRYHVDYLMSLIGEVYDCEGIYGKMDMDMRTSALDNFRRKKAKIILIVTDVAARGIDVPAVQFVVHYDYPTNHKTFVHRSGRTARKGEEGHTIALVSHAELPYLIDLSNYVSRKLCFSSQTEQKINMGTIPVGIMDSYNNIVKRLKEKNQQIKKNEQVANRAFQKFKSCRSQASQSSLRKSKKLELAVHFKFREGQDEEEQNFLNRIKNFNTKRSFIELQRIMANHDVENDNFLAAVEKIRKQEQQQREKLAKRDRLKSRNSKSWKEMLEKDQIKQLEQYREEKNRERIPIKEVEGVEIQIASREKKSNKKDFKNPSQYISASKNPNVKTEFDNLPKIKNSQLDQTFGDENPQKKKKERVWDKQKRNFVWKKDKEDKEAMDDKGKKAYQKWKKKSRLSIPKVGQVEDEQHVALAKENWLQRRKFRHGWRQNKQAAQGKTKGVNLKNNKTKAIEKKFKKRLIGKAQKGKSPSKFSGRDKPGKGSKKKFKK